MGNKEEITNLIGRKGSKMTVKSNVKTLALKVYDEQIPDGWEKLKERIKELKKAEYQCLGICDPKKTHEILNELRCHKVCSKTFEVKSNTVRLKRDKKKIQKRFLHTPEQTLEEKAKNWKWTPGK